MTKKILMAGFVCWSVMAVAQASGSNDQAASAAKDTHSKDVASGQASGKVTDPKDVATGQTSGKRQHEPVRLQSVSEDVTPAATQQSSSAAKNKSAQDDWTARVAKGDVNGDGKADVATTTSSSSSSSSNGQARVAAADVNGDGKADAAINTSHSNIKNATDAHSGQPTGKRQHDPVVVTKSTDAASPK